MSEKVHLILAMMFLMTMQAALGSGKDPGAATRKASEGMREAPAGTAKYSEIIEVLAQTATYSWISEAPAEIRDDLESYSSRVPAQKVYLHTDKPEYRTGETIWFRAYLFDGKSHLPITDSSNVYVELINYEGNTMDMRILLAEEGFASGDIRLRSELPDGNYVIRAYTDWMRNFSEEYFYTRYVYINNPGFDEIIPRRDLRSNRRFNRQLRRMSGEYEAETFTERVGDFFSRLFTSWEYQSAFFPEGGNLVEGINNRVAFKLVDPLGHGQAARAEIMDQNGGVISRFSTDSGGIGVFELVPEKGNTYTARVTVNGENLDYQLPRASEDGYSLRINSEGELISANVVSTVNPGNPRWSEELILVGHTRGKPYFTEAFKLVEGAGEVVAEKGSFPSGIAHFTVFTADFRPVAERLVFINHNDELTIIPSILPGREEQPDYFDIKLTLRDYMDRPVEGSFSLSAVTGQEEGNYHPADMLSWLLLGSDLQGMTPDLSGYIHSGEEQGERIDRLLLTHGWRRFDWDKVLEGEIPEIDIVPSRGLTLAGRITDPARNESLRNYPVSMRIMSDNEGLRSTRTGRNGQFAFSGLFFENSASVVLSSRRLPGNYPPVIELNVRAGRGYEYEPGVYTREQNITSRGDDWSRQRRASASPYGHTTSRHVSPQLYGTPDQTLYIDYETSTERTLFEVLRNRATGLIFEGDRIMLRGPSSMMLSNEPRFMLDGTFVDRNTFLNLYPRDVQRVEIFRGTRAAIFGVRGGTGVILAYSRRPGYQGFEDALELVMLGYHTPSGFYSDKIPDSGLSEIERRIGKTIFWDPSIESGGDGEINVRVPLHREMERMVIRVEGTGFKGGIGSAEFSIDIDQR